MKLFCFLLAALLSTQASASSPISKTELLSLIQQDVEFYQSHLSENNPHQLSDSLVNKLYDLNDILSQLRAEKIQQVTWVESLTKTHADVQNLISQVNPSFEIRVLSTDQDESFGSQTSVVRGRVIDSALGTALESANIRLYDSSGLFLRFTRSDSIGRYVFNNLSAGSYLVSVEKSGYETTFYDGVICPGSLGAGCTLNEVNLIVVEENEVANNIDFDLIKYGGIRGKIIDQQSNQNLYSRIDIYDENQNIISSVSTNYQTGEFKASLAAGNYYLKFDTFGYIEELYNNQICTDDCDFSQAQLVTVNLNEETSVGIIQLLAYRPFGGRVLSAATGDPMVVGNSLQRVEVVDADSGYIQNSVSGYDFDNDGSWKIDGVRPGNYYVRSKVPEYLAQYNTLINCADSSFTDCDDSRARVFNHSSNSGTLNVNFRHKLGGKISGRVYYTGSDGNSRSIVTLYNSEGQFIGEQHTDDEVYSFSGLDNGNYYISARPRYYFDSSYLPTLRPSSYCEVNDGSTTCLNPTDGAVITITNFGHKQNNNIRLKPAAQITGVITDSDNQPVGSARVRLWYKENYPGFEVFTAYTDENGRYRFNNVSLSEYYISASKSGLIPEIYNNRSCSYEPCDANSATSIIVSNGETYGDYNFKLTSEAKIQFNLNSPSDIPINGRINVYLDSGAYMDSFGVSNGASEFYLPTGRYHFQYSASNFVTKPYGGVNCYDSCDPLDGNTVSVINNNSYQYSMRVDAKFKIYGTISGPDSSYKRISLYRSNIEIQNQYDNNGPYELYVSTPGAVKVGISESGFYSAFYDDVECETLTCALGQADPLTTPVNGSIEIDFFVRPLIQVSGKVINQQSQPVGGMSVQLRTENNFVSSGFTDANGEFTIPAEAAGTYYVTTGSSDQYINTLYGDVACENYDCDISIGTPISVDIGSDLSGIDVIIKDKGQVNLNQIKFVDGSTASGISVDFYNSDTLNRITSITTDEMGDASNIYLPSGNYKIRANSQSSFDPFYTAYPNINCSGLDTDICLNMGNSISVSAGMSTDVDGFQINKRGVLHFSVTEEGNNQPISGAKVVIYNPNYSQVTSANTDSNGVVEFTGINHDKVYAFVEVSPSSRYKSSLYNGTVCERGLGVDCLFSAGTLIDLVDNTTTPVEIQLTSKPAITVKAIDNTTLLPIAANYSIYNLSRERVQSINSTDFEHTLYLDEGDYYLLMNTGSFNAPYANTAYPNTRCDSSSTDISSCPSQLSTFTANGTPQTLVTQMEIREGINGFVINETTGEPIENVVLDFWRDEPFLNHSGSTVTAANGGFSMNLYDNTYLISTDLDTNEGFMNEIYPDIPCPDGPAIIDRCDVTLGEAVEVPSDEVSTVLIELVKDPIFKDGFN